MRIDYIFSYWIFFWYLLYISGIQTTYNPKFAIVCGLLENLGVSALMLYFGTNWNLIFLFFIMTTLLKIIPLATLWNTEIHRADIYATFILFGLYLAYVYLIGKKTVNDFTKQTKELVLHNRNTLPGMKLLSWLGL